MRDVMDDPLALARRRKIYNCISRNPGVHLRGIRKKLKVETGVLQHHLNVLEKLELVSNQMEGGRKRYFARSGVPVCDRVLLAFARLKRHRDILMHIMLVKEASFQSLVSVFGIQKSTMSFHMSKFVSAGIVNESQKEREKVYRIADPDSLARVLVTYRKSFLDDAVDRFVELWEEM